MFKTTQKLTIWRGHIFGNFLYTKNVSKNRIQQEKILGKMWYTNLSHGNSKVQKNVWCCKRGENVFIGCIFMYDFWRSKAHFFGVWNPTKQHHMKQNSPYLPPIHHLPSPPNLPRHLLLKCHVSFPPLHVPVPGHNAASWPQRCRVETRLPGIIKCLGSRMLKTHHHHHPNIALWFFDR